MYSVAHSQQLSIFIGALGLGFLLGILYDVLRAIRLTFTSSKVFNIFFDLLYFFIFGISTFMFILALNKGEVRLYIIAGEIIGAAFYYISFGIAAIKITNRFSKTVKRLFHFVIKIIFSPFRFIYRIFSRLSEKITKHLKKTKKNSEKISKKHLQKLRIYVYNLSGIILAHVKHSKKGGDGFDSNKTKEKDT